MKDEKEIKSTNTNAEKKICPILTIAAGGEFLVECIGEDCMFWDREKEDCIFNIIAHSISNLKKQST